MAGSTTTTPPTLPGFYYDKEKGKYFKIESSSTTPPDAAWSSENVKKRKREQSEQSRREALLRRRANAIERNFALRNPVHGELLKRELGTLGKRGAGDLSVWAYCESLGDTGSIIVPNRPQHTAMGVSTGGMNPFCVSSCQTSVIPHKAALHWAASTRSPTTVSRVYFDTPERGTLWTVDESTATTQPQIPVPLVTEIKYHAPTDNLIVVGHGGLDAYHAISTLPVFRTSPDSIPLAPMLQIPEYSGRGLGRSFHCTPASANAGYLCTVGTSRGILVVDQNFLWEVITANPSHRKKSAFADIFVADPAIDNPRVIYAAGRPGYCWTVDRRLPNTDFTTFNHGITINHVRSINPYQVLVAGLKSRMAVYDHRWLGRDPEKRALPYTPFPEYKNYEHLDLGFDVDLDSGVVAAAYSTGDVGLFSLRSGIRVGSVERDVNDVPVRCLQFHTLPGELWSDLYLGHTSNTVARCSRRIESDEASKSGLSTRSVGKDNDPDYYSFAVN